MNGDFITILLIILVLLIGVLVGVVAFMAMKLMKSQEKAETSVAGQRIAEPKTEEEKTSSISSEDKMGEHLHYCKNHPDDHAAGVCAICQVGFCEECLIEHEGHNFCADHFRIFVSHEWDEIDTIKTNPDTPETALPLYDFKKELWEKEETPSILSTHYKINIEGDFIESYVKLVVRKEEVDELRKRYSLIKQ